MTTENEIYIDWGPELPAHHGEDIIVAMVRDPDCLAFYWDARGSLAGLVARVKRLTDGIHYDIELPESLTTWHLAGKSNHTYQLELYRRGEDGNLELRATSNELTLPVRHAWEAAHKPGEVAEAERSRIREMARSGEALGPEGRATEPVSPPERLQAPSETGVDWRDYTS